MMRYIKHHLEGVAGVEIYPIVSLLIFFIFFVGLFIYVAKKDKTYINEVSNLPLEEDQNSLL